MKWILYVLAGAVALLLGLFLWFRFAVKPKAGEGMTAAERAAAQLPVSEADVNQPGAAVNAAVIRQAPGTQVGEPRTIAANLLAGSPLGNVASIFGLN